MAKFMNRKVRFAPNRIALMNIPQRSTSAIVNENKENKNIEDMTTQDKIMQANSILEAEAPIKVKKVKRDKGLIERTESSKIVLTEDNKELLND